MLYPESIHTSGSRLTFGNLKRISSGSSSTLCTGGNSDIAAAKALKADIAEEFARHGV
jgi:hypothetical protein